MSFSLTNTTRSRIPSLPFETIATTILGADYELSVVFVGQKKMHELNAAYRHLDKATDVLSFSLSKTSGELFLCPEILKKKAPEYDKTYEQFLGFLFIHGLFHLKGMDHSATMEKAEEKIRQRFHI